MKFKTLTGSFKTVSNPRRYLIDWDASARSKFQTQVKNFLRPYWENDYVFEEFKMAGSSLTFDLYNHHKKVVIEVQGEQHFKYNAFFHGNKRGKFLSQLKRDDKKFRFCELNGLTLVEIYPKDSLSTELFAKFGVIL